MSTSEIFSFNSAHTECEDIFLSLAALHISMVLNLRMPSPASSLFHQVLLLALEVMPAAYRKIVRPLRMSTQTVRS